MPRLELAGVEGYLGGGKAEGPPICDCCCCLLPPLPLSWPQKAQVGGVGWSPSCFLRDSAHTEPRMQEVIVACEREGNEQE